MNRTSLFVLSAALVLPVALGAVAAPTFTLTTADTKDAVAEGTIKSVDAKASSFVLTTGTGKDAKDITVKVSKDTKYTLDGKESTMEKALAAGHKAKVTHKDNNASKVDATTPAKKK